MSGLVKNKRMNIRGPQKSIRIDYEEQHRTRERNGKWMLEKVRGQDSGLFEPAVTLLMLQSTTLLFFS